MVVSQYIKIMTKEYVKKKKKKITKMQQKWKKTEEREMMQCHDTE